MELRTMILGHFLVISLALNVGFLYRDYWKGNHHYQEFFSFKNECQNASVTLLEASPQPFSSSSKGFDGLGGGRRRRRELSPRSKPFLHKLTTGKSDQNDDASNYKKYWVPLYAAAWVPPATSSTIKFGSKSSLAEPESTASSASNQHIVLAGGGGEGHSGIPNALLVSAFDFTSNSLSDQPVGKLGTGSDLPYRIAVHPGGEGLICSLPKSCSLRVAEGPVFKMEPEKTLQALKDIVPAALNNINAKFVLLDKDRVTLEGRHKKCLALVADETAAVHFQLWGDECDAFEPGDIILLANGIFSYNRNNLVLRAGKRGKVEKVGEFTMTFVETPNMSEIRWVPYSINSKKYVQEAVIFSHSHIFPPMH